MMEECRGKRHGHFTSILGNGRHIEAARNVGREAVEGEIGYRKVIR